jgi:hypothetical protein
MAAMIRRVTAPVPARLNPPAFRRVLGDEPRQRGGQLPPARQDRPRRVIVS